MTISQRIKGKIEQYQEEIKETRRFLHENPELSGHEHVTGEYLKKKCKDWGLLVEEVKGSTGFTALLDTGKPGKTLGIRTDIDALPIEENPYNLKNKKVAVSKNPGISHACGHDSHMATALFAARVLKDLEDEISGKVYFIFEEGEETGSGIGPMIDHLKDKGLDAVYGNHENPFLKVGQFNIEEGPVHAGCAWFDFEVIGQGGHGSRPDLLANPLIAASHIVTNLNSAWNNQLNLEKPISLGIGAIEGGKAANVIPERASIRGTSRFFDIDQGRKALELIKNIGDLTARAHGCRVHFSEATKIITEPIINDQKLTDLARKSLESIYKEGLVESKPSWGSETFYGYGKLCPTVFTSFGVGNEEKGIGAGPHTDKFDLDEEGINYAVGLCIKFSIDFLKESNQ